jgi:hypothetical protein
MYACTSRWHVRVCVYAPHQFCVQTIAMRSRHACRHPLISLEPSLIHRILTNQTILRGHYWTNMQENVFSVVYGDMHCAVLRRGTRLEAPSAPRSTLNWSLHSCRARACTHVVLVRVLVAYLDDMLCVCVCASYTYACTHTWNIYLLCAHFQYT